MSPDPQSPVTFDDPSAGARRADASCPVARFAGNPVLTCHDVNDVWGSPALKVKTVHNAGIAEHEDRVVMLFRSHLRNGTSVLGLARSDDGVHDWQVQPEPALLPCREGDGFADGTDPASLIANEAGGVEDPRVTRIGDTYYVTYSAYHGHIKDRVRVSLATTTDFVSFVRHGPVLDQDMRNVVIFPERIGGKFVGLFRPNDRALGDVGGTFTEIRIGTTERIESNRWAISDRPLLKTGGGPSAFADKIGPGAPPLRSRHGWLSIFHGVRTTMDGNPYVLGVALHDLEDPGKIQASAIPILFPSRSDCAVRDTDYVHVPNVVFTCGALRRDDGTILIHYGGNDTVMNVGVSHEDVLAELCRRYPMDRTDGRPAFDIRAGLCGRAF
ncbi:MAG: glycoside hydrolase family 130 protein [Planctomycetota bacterium]